MEIEIVGFGLYDTTKPIAEQSNVQEYLATVTSSIEKQEEDIEYDDVNRPFYRPMFDGSIPQRARKNVYIDTQRGLKVIYHITYNKPIEAPDFMSSYFNNITIEVL